MPNLRFGVALCALALAACGGGGDSSTPPPTGGGGGGGGTPTPTPPAITYTAFNNLTGDRTFRTACALGANNSQNFQTSVFNDPGGITFSFAEASQIWTNASNGGFGEFSETFGPADLVENIPGVRTFYQRADPNSGFTERFVFGTPQWPSATADYVRGAFFQSSNGGSFNCVFGVPTQTDDRLPTSTITYSPQLDAFGTLVNFNGQTATTYDLDPTTGTITADPVTGIVTISVNLRGFEFSFDANGNRVDSSVITEFGTTTGQAQVTQGAQGFLAQMEKANGIGFVAAASGWFFGPQGEEIGIVFSGRESLVDGSNVSFSFGISAQRNP